MKVVLKRCAGNCQICKGYGGQCTSTFPTIRSFLWWKVVMGSFWRLRDLLYWATNMHWHGNDPKRHWFCYKKNIDWATEKRGVLGRRESDLKTKEWLTKI